MIVSVIVTTKNEEKNIANCLRSIKEQSYPQEKIEIIVVDNNSSDRTKEIARKYTNKVYNCGPERSAQGNLGVEKANGKYLILLDADQILNEGVVEECFSKIDSFFRSKYAEKYEDIALQIPEIIIGGTFFNKIRNFEKQFYTNTVIDCVRVMSKKVFEDVGGYDLNMKIGPDDWDLDKRVRQSCYVDVMNSVMYHNEGNVTLLKFLKKKWYYSSEFNYYIDKWGKDDLETKKRFGSYYRYFGVFFETSKWKKALRHPFLFLCVLLTKVLVGFVYIVRVLKDRL